MAVLGECSIYPFSFSLLVLTMLNRQSNCDDLSSAEVCIICLCAVGVLCVV